MKTLLSMLVFCVAGYSQVTVSGTITDGRAQPIAGAQITLKTLNRTVTTDAQGRYTFSISPVGEYFSRFNSYQGSGSQLRIQLITPSVVGLSAYDLTGKRQQEFYSKHHTSGEFTIDISSARYSRKTAASPAVGLLKLTLGAKEHVIKYTRLNGRLLVHHTRNAVLPGSRALEKSAAAWDQLEASADGYISRTAEVSSSSAVVNLTLALDYRDFLASGNKPNVLLIYSDQHMGAAVGYMGFPDVLTPNMDKMAEEGVAFTRMYVQNNICASSRQSVMTGLYPRTIGQFTNADKPAVQSKVTPMALVFQENGYQTYSTGKRHLLPDGSMPNHKWIDRGWDKSEGGIHREEANVDYGDSYVEWLMKQPADPNRPDTSHLMAYAIDWSTTSGQGPSGPSNCGYCGSKFTGPKADLATRTSVSHVDYTVDAWSKNNAVREIKNRDKNKPFFIWTTYMKPHQPYTPQQKYLDMYDALVSNYAGSWGDGLANNSTIKKPSNLEEPVGNLPPTMRSRRTGTNPIWNGGTAAEDHQIYRDYIAAYYAMITEVDDYVGEFMQVLEDEGIADNTIIIYTSDHGEFAGRHGIPEKSSAAQVVYEETLNVPFIIRWPGYLSNDYTVTSLAQHLDLYPTLMELTGLSKEGIDQNDSYPLQGKSLIPSLTEGKETGLDYVVAENWRARTILTETHKLTKWYKAGETIQDPVNFNDMLFDYSEYEEDEGPALPSETENHINDAGYSAVKADLESKLSAWEASTDATGRNQLLK